MSTLRKDPLTNSWVIFAEERYQKFPEVTPLPSSTPSEECPFCPGHESMTPPEILGLRAPQGKPNAPDWTLRTIPNQFAVLHIEGKFERRGEGLYDMMNGIGAHEVVIETPQHDCQFDEFSIEKIREILWAFRERSRDLMQDSRFRYIQIFRNHGELAGATITHPHSQIIALPIWPRWVREEIVQAHEYWLVKERCIFCDIIDQDLKGNRVAYENNSFVAVEPFASKFPFETWIYPKEHSPSFHLTTDNLLAELADCLKTTVTAFNRALSSPPFNLIFHSTPTQPEKQYNSQRAWLNDYYHWHIEIVPRGTRMAGFELGTGFYINHVLPENAAEYLRQVVSELH